MLTEIHPRLPMRDKAVTRDFYVRRLGFTSLNDNFPDYLMLRKDNVEIHFFRYTGLDPLHNDGMCYIRTDDVEAWYRLALREQLDIPELGHLEIKPWRQREFALRDPDGNLLTFGSRVS